MATALVRYAAGQVDDSGNAVSTKAFVVEFDNSGTDTITAIADTGNVQFDWELVDLSE